MKRLCFIVPFFKRPEITRLCFVALKAQADKYGFEVITCGDDESLAKEFGFKFFYFENDPLTDKMNFLISKTKKFKSVVLLGSDDFVSDETIEMYLSLDVSKPVMYGIRGVYFYRVTDNAISYYENSAQTVGAGRMFTKPLLDALEYNVWRKKANKGLDYIALETVLLYGEEIEIKGCVVDVKHGENITDHSILEMGEKVESLPFEIKGLDGLKPIQIIKKRKHTLLITQDTDYQKKGDILSINSKSIDKQAIFEGWAQLIS